MGLCAQPVERHCIGMGCVFLILNDFLQRHYGFSFPNKPSYLTESLLKALCVKVPPVSALKLPFKFFFFSNASLFFVFIIK